MRPGLVVGHGLQRRASRNVTRRARRRPLNVRPSAEAALLAAFPGVAHANMIPLRRDREDDLLSAPCREVEQGHGLAGEGVLQLAAGLAQDKGDESAGGWARDGQCPLLLRDSGAASAPAARQTVLPRSYENSRSTAAAIRGPSSRSSRYSARSRPAVTPPADQVAIPTTRPSTARAPVASRTSMPRWWVTTCRPRAGRPCPLRWRPGGPRRRSASAPDPSTRLSSRCCSCWLSRASGPCGAVGPEPQQAPVHRTTARLAPLADVTVGHPMSGRVPLVRLAPPTA